MTSTISPRGPRHSASKAAAAGNRLPGLEGTRGLLAAMVVLVHTTLLLTPGVLEATKLGYLGNLIVFFHVMSAFFIYMPYLSAIVEERKFPGTGEYAINRALRVFPAYLTAFLVSNFIFQAVYVQNAYDASATRSDQGSGMITDPVQLLLQLTLLHNYFPTGLQTGLNPSWTLTMEIAFYAILPLLSLGCYALRKRTRINRWLLALLPAFFLLALGVAGRTFAVMTTPDSDNPLHHEWGASWHAVLARSFLLWCDNFAFGLAAAVLFLAVKRGKLASTPRMRALMLLLVVLGVGATGAAILLQSHYVATVLSVASGAALLLIVLPTPGSGAVPWIARALDVKPLKYLGDISLSIYLWHYPVLLLVTRWKLIGPDSYLGALWNFGLVLGITIVLSVLSYHFVELPAMKLRPRNKKARAAAAAPREPEPAAK
ncbi:hypothetical protein BIU82_09410 [Arthrobacter sp. SW1]|uniref:acyltransferase family protein n=1 Tax=Arthrobacter sp. SW1 TaxID=1920889 RepID=UPI000877CB1D|nr:acyltransferase [Arthrobacter sp. SW1]OFI37291.1 hypothetical protein BIU82_09410 [Arthrobacter sp. SW1]